MEKMYLENNSTRENVLLIITTDNSRLYATEKVGGTKENRHVVGAVGAFHRSAPYWTQWEIEEMETISSASKINIIKWKIIYFAFFFLKQMFLKIKTMALFQSQD